RARHDLLLEFFTVAPEAVPRPVRSEAALAEVRLLVEVLADRVAARRAGAVPTARALVSLARARTPEGSLGGGSTAAAGVRLRLLADGGNPWLSGLAYAYAAGVLVVPPALLVLAWT
ncbi:MAG: M56 family metallopeptidase, partial [Phycicoccus sp.]